MDHEHLLIKTVQDLARDRPVITVYDIFKKLAQHYPSRPSWMTGQWTGYVLRKMSIRRGARVRTVVTDPWTNQFIRRRLNLYEVGTIAPKENGRKKWSIEIKTPDTETYLAIIEAISPHTSDCIVLTRTEE